MTRKNTPLQRWISGSLLCGVLGSAACAPAHPPAPLLSQTDLSVHQTNDIGSTWYTPVELQLVRDQLDKARLALDARDYERARLLAEQALADARVAEVQAGTESARQAARDLRLSIETLRDAAIRASVAYLPPYPPVELRLAQEQLDRARLALTARDYERARRLAEQALADARTAEVRAVSESARQAARDLRLSIETLRAEAVRLAALY